MSEHVYDMSDESEELLDDSGAQNGGSTEATGTMAELPDWAREMVRQLREESKQRRMALREAQQKAATAERSALEQAGNWRVIAEQLETEKRELEQYRERAEALEARLNESNDARLKRIPVEWRSMVPTDYAPERLAAWLDANAERLMKPAAPTLDAGAGGGVSQPALNDDERRMAQAAGMTNEEYAKAKARMGL